MSESNPFFARVMDNHRANLTSRRDQENSFYRREELNIGAQYTAELERYKAGETRSLEYLKHDNNLEIEEKKGGILKWIEEFKGGVSKDLETLRQGGSERLQEREHVHRRLLLEIDQAESRLRADEAHAQQLSITNKTAELATFQKQRESVYALEAARFNGLIAERQTYTAQIIAEYSTRSTTGQSVIAATAAILAGNRSDSAKMNEMILAAAIAKKANATAHKHRIIEIQAGAEAGANDKVRQEIDRKIDDWDKTGGRPKT